MPNEGAPSIFVRCGVGRYAHALALVQLIAVLCTPRPREAIAVGFQIALAGTLIEPSGRALRRWIFAATAFVATYCTGVVLCSVPPIRLGVV